MDIYTRHCRRVYIQFMSFSFKVSISKTFHLKVFFFFPYIFSLAHYILLFPEPETFSFYWSAILYIIAKKRRRRGGEEARLCVRTLVISFSFLSLFFFSVAIRNGDVENVKKKMAAADRKILVCVKKKGAHFVWGDQSNKQSPWLDKGKVPGQKTGKLRVATERTWEIFFSSPPPSYKPLSYRLPLGLASTRKRKIERKSGRRHNNPQNMT